MQPTPRPPRKPRKRRTWEDLVKLEPRLLQVEADVRKARRDDWDAFD